VRDLNASRGLSYIIPRSIQDEYIVLHRRTLLVRKHTKSPSFLQGLTARMVSCSSSGCCIRITWEVFLLLSQLALEEASILAMPQPSLLIADGMKLWMAVRGIEV